ncbi:MAG: 50S ribosomal protein L23 [Pseudomonadales bacterium]|nr:50S ribosomal protein L23 [Pseudomonadales bacterium]
MNAYTIVKPVITEKSLTLANEKNIYTFEVSRGANKHQIKEAVEQLFPVAVVNVRTVTNQPSIKRTGKRRMQVTGGKVKKALVTLKSGDEINLFDISESIRE